MRRVALKCLSIIQLIIILVIVSPVYAQSLADAARANRKQKAESGAASGKVITADDPSAPGVIHLVPGSSAAGEGTLVAPGRGKHNYRVVALDATRFVNGGTLHITITMGAGESEASFDLYPQGLPMPEEGLPNSLASAHNVSRTNSAKITYHFAHADTFQFAAEGSWNSKAGAANNYSFVVDVDSPSTK